MDLLKRAARQRALAARTACDPSCGEALARHVLAEAPPPSGAVVAGFWPLAGEIDIRPLLFALLDRRQRLVLPETPPRGQPLVFHEWRAGETLRPGRFGTMHAAGAALVPDFLLVPMLAFDRRGHRLGYGAGYYDRTLACLPGITTLGCAFAVQEMEAVPVGPHDARLDAVATERGVIFCGDG